MLVHDGIPLKTVQTRVKLKMSIDYQINKM